MHNLVNPRKTDVGIWRYQEMKMKINNSIKWSLLASTGLLISACAGTPVEVPQLNDARTAYTKANQDPITAKNAPVELDDAKKSLSIAERFWKDGEDKEVVEHYAYITAQQVEIARYRAQTIDNQKQMENNKVERQRVLLEVRAAEIEKSQKQAEAAQLKAEKLSRKAAEIQRQMTQLQAKQTGRGMVLTLGDVLFDLNKASLKPGSERKISKIAQFMVTYPNKNVAIEGHTDSTGDNLYNVQLSSQRAEAVKAALMEHGVNYNRIQTQGLGEAAPVASNATKVGRQQNRRVEIIFKTEETVTTSLQRKTLSFTTH